MKREFLMLAQNLDSTKHNPGGWLASHKLDGMRAFWDGGITRGMLVQDVPFANTEKDARLRTKPVATGLWSRYGKVIHAPDSFLDDLPAKVLLDGELYIGIGKFQELISTVKQYTPGPEWKDVKYYIFDSPPAMHVFGHGRVDACKRSFDTAMSFVTGRLPIQPARRFEEIYDSLGGYESNTVVRLKQEMLPLRCSDAYQRLREMMNEVVNVGGEGIMIRHSSSYWMPERSHALLKLKKALDAEAKIVGFKWGEETDKGSRLLGKIGSLRVEYRGIIFDIGTGLTDEMRVLKPMNPEDETVLELEGAINAGKSVDTSRFYSPIFKIGTVITFRYLELSKDGIPKIASFMRIHTP